MKTFLERLEDQNLEVDYDEEYDAYKKTWAKENLPLCWIWEERGEEIATFADEMCTTIWNMHWREESEDELRLLYNLPLLWYVETLTESTSL